jgi:hypothetical protein
VSDCEADSGKGAAGCDPATFVTSEAAVCVAESAGLETGLSGLTATLSYDSRKHRVEWYVTNFLYDELHPLSPVGGDGGSGGSFLEVDAVTLSVLAKGSWERVP